MLEFPRERNIGTNTKPHLVKQESSRVHVFNALGALAWELVMEEPGRTTITYLFKRRRS